MITAGEVGAVFKIVDEATPVLERLVRQFTALQAKIDQTKLALDTLKFPPGLNRSLGLFGKNLEKIADVSKVTGDTVAATFARIDKAAAATATSVANISRELKAIGSEARVMGNLRYSGGPGVSHRSGGVHFGGQSVALPGEQHMRLAGGPLMAIGGAAAYGTYEDAKLQEAIAKMFLTGGVGTGINRDDPRYKQIRDSILGAYSTTGLPVDQLADAYLDAVRTAAPLPFDQRIALASGVLPNAALESYLKPGTSVSEAMAASIGQAHMSGEYDVNKVVAMSRHMAFLSTQTDQSVESLNRAASYVEPILRIGGYDPGQLLSMITAMQRAGIMNSKSGTWLENMFERSYPGTSLTSKKAFEKHEEELRMLGLIDKGGHQTFLDEAGKPDVFKFMGILGDSVRSMDVNTRLSVFKALFGQQGERAAAFFSDATNSNILRQSMASEKNMLTDEAAWDQITKNSPMVEFRKTWADLNTELMNLGENVLPFVTGALRAANQQMGSKGELGALGAGLLSYMAGGWKGLRSGLIGGGVYAAGDAFLHWLIPDKPAQEAQLADIARLGPLWRLLAPGSASAATPDGYGSKPFGYLNNPNLQGIGNIPPRSMVVPPPQVTVNDSPKVTVNVTLDGRAIAAAVSTQIEKNNRTVNSSAGFDGRAGLSYPDLTLP